MNKALGEVFGVLGAGYGIQGFCLYLLLQGMNIHAYRYVGVIPRI